MNTYILANAEEIYKVNALLSDKQLEDIFGTKDVSLKERAVYFGDLWDSWEENQVRLPAKAVEHYSRYKLQLEYLDVKKVIKDFTEKHELKEMIDYQNKPEQELHHLLFQI